MKNDHHDVCNTRLGLGIGLDDFVPKIREQKKNKNKKVTCLDLSFPLDHFKDDENMDGSSSKENNGEEGRQSMCSIENQEHENYGVIRKKLRLTKEQSCVLEDSFKRQTTLNMAQKHALAEKLHLKPRQIEVWFQNRRARTKLKQTEIDCVYLKRNCENLREENRRLKKELEELRLIMIQRAATCHSCDKFAKSSVKETGHAIKVECNLSRCD